MSADTEQKKGPGSFSEEEADALSEKFTASWESSEETREDPKAAVAPPAVNPTGAQKTPAGGIPLKKTMLGLAPYSGALPAASEAEPAEKPAPSSPFDAAAAALAATHPSPAGGAAKTPATPPPKPATPEAVSKPLGKAKASPDTLASDDKSSQTTDAPQAPKPPIPRQRTLVGIKAPDDDELERLAESFADAPDPVPSSPAPAPAPEPVVAAAAKAAPDASEKAPDAAPTAAAATPTASEVAAASARTAAAAQQATPKASSEPISSPEYAPPSAPPSSAGSENHQIEGSVVVESAAASPGDSERVARQADTIPPSRPDAIAVEIPPEWGTQNSKKKLALFAVVAVALLGTVGLLAALGGDESEPEKADTDTQATAAVEKPPAPAATPEDTQASEEQAPEAEPADAAGEADEKGADDEGADDQATDATEAPAASPKPLVPTPKPKPRLKAKPKTIEVPTSKPKRAVTKPAKKKTTQKKPAIVRESPF